MNSVWQCASNWVHFQVWWPITTAHVLLMFYARLLSTHLNSEMELRICLNSKLYLNVHQEKTNFKTMYDSLKFEYNGPNIILYVISIKQEYTFDKPNWPKWFQLTIALPIRLHWFKCGKLLVKRKTQHLWEMTSLHFILFYFILCCICFYSIHNRSFVLCVCVFYK